MWRGLLVSLVVVALLAIILRFAGDLSTSLSFVAGLVIGAVSLGSVVLSAGALTGRVKGLWALLAGFWRWGHLAVVGVLLAVLVLRWQADPVWLIVGYTVSLIAFVTMMARLKPAQRA